MTQKPKHATPKIKDDTEAIVKPEKTSARSRLLRFDGHVSMIEFLDKTCDSLLGKVNTYKETATVNHTSMYDGQIRYWENQISTMNWLISLIEIANG